MFCFSSFVDSIMNIETSHHSIASYSYLLSFGHLFTYDSANIQELTHLMILRNIRIDANLHSSELLKEFKTIPNLNSISQYYRINNFIIPNLSRSVLQMIKFKIQNKLIRNLIHGPHQRTLLLKCDLHLNL